MPRANGRDLGMHRDISRRDFVNGVGVAIGGSLLAPGWLSAREGIPHAPGATVREVAHVVQKLERRTCSDQDAGYFTPPRVVAIS